MTNMNFCSSEAVDVVGIDEGACQIFEKFNLCYLREENNNHEITFYLEPTCPYSLIGALVSSFSSQSLFGAQSAANPFVLPLIVTVTKCTLALGPAVCRTG